MITNQVTKMQIDHYFIYFYSLQTNLFHHTLKNIKFNCKKNKKNTNISTKPLYLKNTFLNYKPHTQKLAYDMNFQNQS